MTTLDELISNNLYTPTEPLKLHLGCGQTYFPNYINIDYPPEAHVGYRPTADCFADITKLYFPNNSVDEIRLHHVFEHFDRITALVLLVKWHNWLKLNGTLVIETPDFMTSIKQITAGIDYTRTMAIVRHLEGDQTSFWGVHIGQWWNERFENTLSRLGFSILNVEHTQWNRWPYLSNIVVTSTKLNERDLPQQIEQCKVLLKDSTVAVGENRTYNIWCEQLEGRLNAK